MTMVENNFNMNIAFINIVNFVLRLVANNSQMTELFPFEK